MCSAGGSGNGTRLRSRLRAARRPLLQRLPRMPRKPRMRSRPATFWLQCRLAQTLLHATPACFAGRLRCEPRLLSSMPLHAAAAAWSLI